MKRYEIVESENGKFVKYKDVEIENQNLKNNYLDLCYDFIAFIQDYGVIDNRTKEIENKLNVIINDLQKEEK